MLEQDRNESQVESKGQIRMMLLIDSHYLGYQALYTQEGLSYHDIQTGVLYGFLARVLSLGQFFKTNNLIFCWDSKTSLRKKAFEGYKQKRQDNRTEEQKEKIRIAHKQFTLLRREILPAMGFRNCFVQKGLEADDIIAKTAEVELGDKIIVSADADFYQCLAPNLRIWNPTTKRMMTLRKFSDNYGITPKQWIMVKQIAGCDSDSVPGVRGIGEGFAISYIQRTLPVHTKRYKSIKENKETITRNAGLVTLPHPKTKRQRIQATTFSSSGFKHVCKKYGFYSFLQPEQYKAWSVFMSGTANHKGEYNGYGTRKERRRTTEN